MEIQKITYPNHPMEIFRYYYPNSLRGQENGAEKILDIEPDVHSKIIRPDGIETCTCGLVYMNEESGWMSNYGHRHHETGELQPVARIRDEYVNKQGHASITTSYRCEYCGEDEIGGVNFFSVRGPGSRRKNVHICPTDDFPQARWEFNQGRARFSRNELFFTPTPNSMYFDTLGNVSVIVDSSGARLSGTGTHFEEAMRQLLSNQFMLISEASERLLEIAGILQTPSFMAAPVSGEVFDPWRVADSQSNWIYRTNPGSPNGPYGFVRFSSEEVRHLSYSTSWPWANPNPEFVEETLRFKTVKFQMTKDHFVVYSDRIALPVAQVPVVWCTT